MNRNRPILSKIDRNEFQKICIMVEPHSLLHYQVHHMNRVKVTYKLYKNLHMI